MTSGQGGQLLLQRERGARRLERMVGLVAAACFVLLRRRRRSLGLALLGGAAGALVALVVVSTLLWPLATNVLPVFVCAY